MLTLNAGLVGECTAKENIYGCQFHPEKSHSAGLKILENFAKL